MSDEREAQAWLAFASAAVAGYHPPEDEDFKSIDDYIDDICDVATNVADSMVSEYMARFGGRSRNAPPRKGRRRRREEEEE